MQPMHSTWSPSRLTASLPDGAGRRAARCGGRRPGGIHKAIKFVYGDLDAAATTASAAEQELKALNRVKSVRHPFILSLERYRHHRRPAHHRHGAGRPQPLGPVQRVPRQGLPGIPREELLRLHGRGGRGPGPDEPEYQLQHLDIKPQNLFLVHNHIKVADFGLVKDLEGAQATVTGGDHPGLRRPGDVRRRGSAGTATSTAWPSSTRRLLTGRRPFDGTNTRQLILQHLTAARTCRRCRPATGRRSPGPCLRSPEERFPRARSSSAPWELGVHRDRRGAGPGRVPARRPTDGPDQGPADDCRARVETAPANRLPARRPSRPARNPPSRGRTGQGAHPVPGRRVPPPPPG